MEELEINPETTAVPAEDTVSPEIPAAEPQADGDAPTAEVPASVESSAPPEESTPPEIPTSEPQAEGDAPTAEVPIEDRETDPNEPDRIEAQDPTPAEDTAPEEPVPIAVAISDEHLRAILEAVVYLTDEPLTLAQIAAALAQPADRVEAILRQLMAEFEKPEHGIGIREVAGGFKMATKAEHHEAVRGFVKSLKAPLKLSLPALETLAVIAYKQPVTAPEIMEIRGVQGAGVLKTLLDRKVIAAAGRKNVIGKPILYKTTKEFLIQFGLKDIAELPSIKEFEEIRRMAFADTEPTLAEPSGAPPSGAGLPACAGPDTEPAAPSGVGLPACAGLDTEPATAAPEAASPPEPPAEAEATPEPPPTPEPES